jgi:predicted DsbA family dithiol-disulfide isomerase
VGGGLHRAPTVARKVIVPIYFDYASSLCYVAWRIVRELQLELEFEPLWKGVPIGWRSISSRPGKPLGSVELAKIAAVVTETGVQVTPPAHWIDSERALLGSELAREAGVFDLFHDAVFHATFVLGLDISSPSQLAQFAAQAGMDAEAFREALENRVTERRLWENKDEADRFSAIGYPTFMLGEFPLIGIQSKETMRVLLARFIDQRRRELQA